MFDSLKSLHEKLIRWYNRDDINAECAEKGHDWSMKKEVLTLPDKKQVRANYMICKRCLKTDVQIRKL